MTANEDDNDDGYLFLLSITPKEDDSHYSIESITAELGINPTKCHNAGDLFPGIPGKGGMKYSSWIWEFSTPWYKYWPSTNNKSISESFLEFLNSLPKSEVLWDKLSRHCDIRVYMPIERDYFLIEVEFEPDIWPELALRKLRLDISTLSKNS